MRRLLIAGGLLFLLLVVGSTSGVAPIARAATPTSTNIFTATDKPNVLVEPVQGPTVSKQLESRAKASWPWYITRAAGFVAAFSLILLMLSGIGLITGATFRLLEPLTAWATHKAIGYVFGVSVVIHVVALLFDKYVPFTIAQALLPFLSHYRDVTIAGHHLGSLYVALGVVSLYFVIAINHYSFVNFIVT